MAAPVKEYDVKWKRSVDICDESRVAIVFDSAVEESTRSFLESGSVAVVIGVKEVAEYGRGCEFGYGQEPGMNKG